MTTLQPPSPGEPQPLSARERKVLANIENDLCSGDPQLAALSNTVGADHRREPGFNEFLQVVAIIAILALILPTAWTMILGLLLMMAGPPVLSMWATRRASWSRRADRDP